MAGAQEFRAFVVTCPPGVTPDAPQITDLSMPVRTVISIRVRVPPGALSSMGFAIGAAGVPIIPYDGEVFVVTDDDEFTWSLLNQIDSGAWQVQMYNTGQYQHSIYVYFTVELPDDPAPDLSGQPIPAAALGPPPVTVTYSTPVAPAPPPLVLSS